MERLLRYFNPSFYNLELKIDRQHETLEGTVKISGRVRAESVKFHAVNMKIRSIEYTVSTTDEESRLRPCRFQYDGQEILVPISSTMAPYFFRSYNELDYDDEYATTCFIIKFETKLNHNMQGCYLSTYQHDDTERRLAVTQFESHYAREAFPCIDEPEAKAVFSLNLIIPDLAPGDVVLSNTPLSHRYRDHFSFISTPRMSTYLLAWVIGPLQNVSTVNKDGVRVSSYCALNQPLENLIFANRTAARALEYYNAKFGVDYPLPELNQVALPDFEAGAMENWGLVTYRESMLLAEPNASVDVRRSVAVTITHELSHQWFGDLVTMRWWDDLWLNESFATVIEYFATDALYPELKIWQEFFTGDCLAALYRDCLPGVQAVKQAVNHPAEIATLFDPAIVYAKGARLILMLIRLMGEESFYQGLRYYFERYAFGNTVGDDLWSSLQPYADFDVKRFMEAWISQPGYPALQSSSNPHEPWAEQRFLIDGTTDRSKWPIPTVKDDMSGHYVIDLSSEEFQSQLDQFSELSTEQQLRLLIDRMLLARAGLVESASLLDLLPKFQNETSASIFNIVVTIIADLKIFCPPTDEPEGESSSTASDKTAAKSLTQLYKRFLDQVFAPSFAELDYAKLLDTDSICVRDLLLGLARYIENPQVMQQLTALYQDDFAAIDSELRAHVLAAKLRQDESAVFDAWLKEYQSTTDPEIKHTLLAVLASEARESRHLDRLLALLNQTDIVRPQDHVFLYIFLLRNAQTRERTLNWLTTHWDFILQLTGEKSIEDYPRYAANVIRTPAEAQIFYDFFDTKLDDPILARALKVAHAEIDARLQRIKNHTAAFTAKLQALTA